MPEDSSDFDETWTELIVMTWTLIWALFQIIRPKIFPERRRLAEFTESRRPILIYEKRKNANIDGVKSTRG